MPRFLCRIGLHKWRYEDAGIISRDAREDERASDYALTRGGGGAISVGRPIPIGTEKTYKTEAVFTKRECQRCGIKQEKRVSENDQGNKTPISGWEKTV